MTKEIIETIKEMLRVLHRRNIQHFRGDKANYLECYNYFEKLGCSFFTGASDYDVTMYNLEIILNKLLETKNAKTST